MIMHKGKRYSVRPKYIGQNVTVSETDDGNLCIYYNNDCIASHPLTENKYHFTLADATKILSSDAYKEMSDGDVENFIKNNLSDMDIYLVG